MTLGPMVVVVGDPAKRACRAGSVDGQDFITAERDPW